MRLVTGDIITLSAFALIMSVVGVVTIPDWEAAIACVVIGMLFGGLAFACYKENCARQARKALWALEQL